MSERDARPPGEDPYERRHDEEEPTLSDYVGLVGVYVMVISLVLTVAGLVALALRIQPFGLVALTLAIAGATVGMTFGTIAGMKDLDPVSDLLK